MKKAQWLLLQVLKGKREEGEQAKRRLRSGEREYHSLIQMLVRRLGLDVLDMKRRMLKKTCKEVGQLKSIENGSAHIEVLKETRSKKKIFHERK